MDSDNDYYAFDPTLLDFDSGFEDLDYKSSLETPSIQDRLTIPLYAFYMMCSQLNEGQCGLLNYIMKWTEQCIMIMSLILILVTQTELKGKELTYFQPKYKYFMLLIINDISMIGKLTFDGWNIFLQQIKGKRLGFDEVSVLVIGDFTTYET